jgi:hypothetical protein
VTREIKEADWKIFKHIHAAALERFCQQILLEIERLNADDTKSFQQKYSAIYAVIQKRDKEVALIFNDFRRSTALIQLAAMKARGLLTEAEISQLSQETQNILARLLGHQAP